MPEIVEEILSDAVAVVIVNYKTANLVCRNLESLERERQFLPNLHVCVVDNASPDDSYAVMAEFVEQKAYTSWVTVIAADKNGGYAYGNNVGFHHFMQSEMTFDYYWMLNPDTYLRPKAGLALVQFVKENPTAIAGSRLEDEDGTAQTSTFNFPSVATEVLGGFSLGLLDKIFRGKNIARDIVNEREAVDWVAGASMLFNASVLLEVGIMDQKYFLYFEEVDYCLAMSKAGYQCWYVPESKIVHEVGASTGISDVRKKQPRRPQYWFDSRRRYFTKNHGFFALLLADIGWSVGYATWLVRKQLTGSSDVAMQPPHLLRDFLKNSAMNPGAPSKA